MFPWRLSDDFSELVKDGYKDTDLSDTIGKLTWVAWVTEGAVGIRNVTYLMCWQGLP